MMELIKMSIHGISLALLTACFSCVAEKLNSPWMVALCHLMSNAEPNRAHPMFSHIKELHKFNM